MRQRLLLSWHGNHEENDDNGDDERRNAAHGATSFDKRTTPTSDDDETTGRDRDWSPSRLPHALVPIAVGQPFALDAHDSMAAMRVFSVGSDGGFTEYERLPVEVEHEESVLEKWLESNPNGILEDGRILIIGRQVRTDLGGFIDLVGVDREGNAVVVELKRDCPPRDVVAQALEYAAFAERLDADALEGIFRVYHWTSRSVSRTTTGSASGSTKPRPSRSTRTNGLGEPLQHDL